MYLDHRLENAMADVEKLLSAIRARASALRGLGYKVRFDLSDTGRSLLLDATSGRAEVEEAEDEAEADCVLRLSSDDLAKLIEGRLSPMLAFSTGRLRVDGSKGVAMKLASLLDED
jgi:putative sterol carrier protein